MLTEKEINLRNGFLLVFISQLNLGIHVLEIDYKAKLISPDYKWWFNAYIKNFHLILLNSDNSKDIYLDIRLKMIHEMNVEELKSKIIPWMINLSHKKVYTLQTKNELFLTGFNKEKKPIFSIKNPLIYNTIEKVTEIKNKFSEYDLIIV